MTTGWIILRYEGVHHVLPKGEQHDWSDCRCQPVEAESGVLVHQAFDERDKFERGERSPS
jgi:hypothetical protein